MHVWKQATAYALSFILIAQSALVSAQTFQCASDLDNDGDLTGIGEVAACITATGGSPFCPIEAVDCIADTSEVCPIDADLPCVNGECTTNQPSSCEYLPHYSGTEHVYRCPITGELFSSLSSETASRHCFSVCSSARTQACVDESEYSCPLGAQHSCTTTSASLLTPQCTPNACHNIDEGGVVETLEGISSDMYMDDGERNADGACLGESRLFSGRPMSCRLPGASSAWKNCCTDNKGKVYHDSKGNVVEDTLTNKAITATAAAAWAAGTAFSTAVSAGATTAQASQAGGQAFVNSLQGAFDPTSLAIAVAIALIQNWLANACNQRSMETAVLRASGYCILVGEICTHRFLGSCMQKEEVHCCYNSKMARIINEQGMPQINEGLDFSQLNASELTELDCGGFSPDEFQSLDFSRIDFSEYVEDINSAITDRVNTEGMDAVERFTNENVE
jgi:hypothetical protein